MGETEASWFRLTTGQIDGISLRQRLENPRCGAVVVFEGVVRDHHRGRAVGELSYEAYVDLASREGNAIVTEALSKYSVDRILAEHRIGRLAIGEVAVFVGVAAAHRDAAFAACRVLIDEIKTRVPIWKHERYIDGEAEWIHPD